MIASRIIQIVGTYNRTYWLMDNGEVYSVGENGNYGLGNSETTDEHIQFVTANDTTDWQGNAITKTLTKTKIVKIGLSDMHSGNGTSTMWALGDDGSIWVWGYNNNGQSGLGNAQANASTDTTGGNINIASIQKCYKSILRMHNLILMARKLLMYTGQEQKNLVHALDESGQLWGWGHNQHGEIGVGNFWYLLLYMQLTKLVLTLTDTVKLLKHYWSDGSQHASIILDGEGYIWFTGYQTNGNSLLVLWLYRNISYWFLGEESFHMNDIDYFWIGGDEKQMVLYKTKNQQVCCGNHDGNYGTYGGRGQSVESNSYWYQSGGQTSQFTSTLKFSWEVNVVCVEQNRGDGSYIYEYL